MCRPTFTFLRKQRAADRHLRQAHVLAREAATDPRLAGFLLGTGLLFALGSSVHGYLLRRRGGPIGGALFALSLSAISTGSACQRHYLYSIGEAYFFSRQFDEAAANLLASLERAPEFPITYRVLASCYAHMGRLDEAGEIVRGLRAVTPAVMEPGTRYRNPELRELFLSGLRMAAGEIG
jgi:tetratricopeptide (TPR) repeat protein